MPHFRVQIRERHRLMLLLMSGLLISILFLGRAGDSLQYLVENNGGILAENLTEVLREGAEKNGGERITGSAKDSFASILIHVLGSRLWLPSLWVLLSFTVVGSVSLYLLWIYLGFSVGILLWTVVMAGGWRGPFYFWGLIFPQYLLYMPALLLFYVGCLRWHTFWRERGRHMRVSILEPQLRLFALRIFLGTLLYAAGIWIEVNVNPWVLKKIFIIS